MPAAEETPAIVAERYKYILQQIHTVNENVYRFLTIFQTLLTAIVTAALALFVSYSKWGISPSTARTGVTGFRFPETRNPSYPLLFLASPKKPSVEHSIRKFIDVLEEELRGCRILLDFCDKRWRILAFRL